MYIFRNPERVSDSYHDGGSVAVVASTGLHVQELIKEHNDSNEYGYRNARPRTIISDEDWANAELYMLHDDFDYEPKVMIFPDAGCC